jgi:fido (protein-threonine AMPylation protein)
MLSEDFMRTLHKRMFGDVREWAGTFRTTERNIWPMAVNCALATSQPSAQATTMISRRC